MAGNKDVLAQELKQIIEADRKANSIINAAYKKQKETEAEAEEQSASIVAVAKQKKAEMEERVRAEQERTQNAREAQLNEQINTLRKNLQETTSENKAKWVNEIVGRITAN